MAISNLIKPSVQVNIQNIGSYTVEIGTTLGQLIDSLEHEFSYPVVAGIFDNNQMKALHHQIKRDCEVQIIDTSSEIGLQIYRRSVVFLFIKACRDIFPERKLLIKHSLSNGLLCEFLGIESNDEEIAAVEKRMKEIVADDIAISRSRMKRDEAYQLFMQQGQEDKVKLLEYRHKENLHVYELDGFYEYFYGYMVDRSSKLDKFKIINYSPGIVLQTPEKDNWGTINPYREQKKLAMVYREAKEWAEMLKTPHLAAMNEAIEQSNIEDIIRVNEALHEKKIAYIADTICNDPKLRLVLIAGPSSSGKTTFAQRLLIQLRVNGRNPVSISLDNYFVDQVKTPRDENGDYDFESIDALKLDLFNEHLQRLIKGEEVEMPVYNFKKGKCEARGIPVRVPAGEPIIIEGIHGLNDRLTSSIASEQKFKIYISALTQLNIDYSNRIPTTDCRLIRRIVRDSRTRGYNALNTIKRWPSVRRGEEINIFPYQENADIMFNSSLVYELAVLKPFAEPLLMEIGAEQPEYLEAKRLLKFMNFFRSIRGDSIPPNSIIREFIGGSWFKD